MKLRSCSFLIAFAGSLAGSAQADVKLPALFSDHAVLQRDATVPVWGWAAKGEDVAVSIAGQTQSTKADAHGKWRVDLKNLSAGGPHELTVKGTNTLTIKDVLIGEVWLGSGQSNMAMTVMRAKDYEKEKAAAKLPLVRQFTARSTASPTPKDDVEGKWEVCSPETVGGFSATLFFTGREIHRELKVPVGLINSSVGGTPIESWIDAATQAATSALKPYLEGKKKDGFDPDKAADIYAKQVASWEAAVKKAKALKQTPPRKPRDPAVTHAVKGDIGGLFNGKINGLIPYAIKGAIWYQGEANSQPGKSEYYEHQLPLLVTDWRKRWGYDFPFAWVQLPNYGTSRGDNWCQVREAMLKTLKLPKTGMAVTLDIGEEKDIHPKNKQEVGRRLSLWALGAVYGGKNATSGPLFSGGEVKSGDVVISFTHTDGGLVFKGEPKGFVIAGEDQKWQPAMARIDGDKVIISSAAVAKPVAARYAWSPWPPCTLWNGAGLPASPFRTDTWPMKEPQAAVIKVACVGDSITAGVGARDHQRGTYPAQLQTLLGNRYEVRNFGVSGSTLLRSGDKPYDKEANYQAALDYKPDMVVLKLGTNDSKPQNWAHQEDFIPSAKALIAAFREANPRVRINICLPIPAYPENFGITDKVIKGAVIPALRKVAREEKARVIDLYTPMKDQAVNVPDKVHPNDAGYRIMAAIVAKSITGKEAQLDLLPSLEPGAR